LHRDIVGATVGGGIIKANVLTAGTVLVHVRVNDQDFNVSPIGTDNLQLNLNDPKHGPVAVQITRGQKVHTFGNSWCFKCYRWQNCSTQ